MIYLIIIFVLSTLVAFAILSFSAWEVENGLRNRNRSWKVVLPPIRHFEKYLLYSLKHFIQHLVLLVVKYWLLFTTKTKKWFIKVWPKIKERFRKAKGQDGYPKNPSFVRRAVFESKIKIKRMKQKIREENDLKR